MKNILAAMATLVVAIVLIAGQLEKTEAQTGASATNYGSQRITNGAVFIEPALSLQFPAALLNGALNVTQPITPITTLSAANTAVTLTLPAVAGQFHYITSITATRTCTTAITGSALLGYTSTNLPNTMAWTAGNACAVGSTNQDLWNDFSQPIKSSVANTNTTIVAPAAGVAGQIRLSAFYYTAP